LKIWISRRLAHPSYGKKHSQLRAGMMPPPGVRRPPVASTKAENWLEAEMDAKRLESESRVVCCIAQSYRVRELIRDLLDLEIDPPHTASDDAPEAR